MQRDPSLRDGMRAALPLILPVLVFGISFGVVAQPIIGGLAASAMSATIIAGASQIAAVTVLDSGGGAAAAVVAGLLMNARFFPMALAVAPALRGSRLRQLVEVQAAVDASFVLADQGDGTFSRGMLVGSWLPQTAAWVGGTVIGVLLGEVIPDPQELGLDVVLPAFFITLLVRDVRASGTRRTFEVIGLAIAITLALTPVAPAGMPVVAAAAAALLGLRR
ncbi:MAG: AzlC family ABC transporter permease [Solirubrobacteraceae bacterium]|nr:AzlC family ABC transporter permease [Solirubrobacteraceae bacterium]